MQQRLMEFQSVCTFMVVHQSLHTIYNMSGDVVSDLQS
jgi:hypothetical protein